MNLHKYPYNWKLSDLDKVEPNGYKAASIFSGGGGSSMGLKLAGFGVIGCVEIDPKMIGAYRANLNPKYSYCEDIREFNKRDDLPPEFYDLDLLDGSPPCSSFSKLGNREKDWGKAKKFAEGYSVQILDDLFFHAIETVEKLGPKVAIFENVLGIIQGKAKRYSAEIFSRLNAAGYYVSIHILDASTMGVPQRRQRVFFIGLRMDLAGPFIEKADLFSWTPRIKLKFHEPPITYGDIEEAGATEGCEPFYPYATNRWEKAKPGEHMRSESGGGFGYFKLSRDVVAPTLLANDGGNGLYHPDIKRMITKNEAVSMSSFPTDYNFGKVRPKYICGMSVPPVMMAQIGSQIRLQWIDNLK